MDTVDNKTSLRMQLLAREASLMEYVFFNSKTGGFWRIPAEDTKAAPGIAAVEDVVKNGFQPLVVLALMDRATPDGKPLIEEERFPGADEEKVQKARGLFIDSLIRDGVLKPDTGYRPT